MIIDIHTHITEKGMPLLLERFSRKPFTAATLLRVMDKEGIDKSVVLPLSNPENTEIYAVAGNKETVRECSKHADRLIPFCNIDPRAFQVNPSADFSPLMRMYRDMGCLGIGEICANLPITHRLYQNLFHHAGEQKMPLLFHFTGRASGLYGVRDAIHLPGLEQMLKAFPNTVFIGHGPAFWSEIEWDVRRKTRDGYPKGRYSKKGRLWTLLSKYRNLYGDISAGSGHNALSRSPEHGHEFLQKFNRQLFFGTDRFGPGLKCPAIIGFMKDALANRKITKSAYNNIMSGNFKRVIEGGKK